MAQYVATTTLELLELLRKATEDDEIILRGDATFAQSIYPTEAVFVLKDSVKLKAPMLNLRKVIVKDRAEFFGQAEWIEVMGAGKATVHYESSVYAMGNARVDVWDRTYVEAYDSAVVHAFDATDVHLFNRASCQAFDESTVYLHDPGATANGPAVSIY